MLPESPLNPIAAHLSRADAGDGLPNRAVDGDRAEATEWRKRAVHPGRSSSRESSLGLMKGIRSWAHGPRGGT